MSFTRAVALFLLATPALAQTNPVLRHYTVCKFDDGLAITEKSPLPANVQGRSVDTNAGPQDVALLRGERIMFAYPATDFFANVKAEQLPPDTYAQGKQVLIANFDHILAGGDDSSRNMTYALHPMLNGFEVYGLDRNKLEGQTLGIYLLIDDKTHVIATAYFVNQEPNLRKFSTIAEYAGLRDHFLTAYTACVHAPHAAPAPVRAAKRKR